MFQDGIKYYKKDTDQNPINTIQISEITEVSLVEQACFKNQCTPTWRRTSLTRFQLVGTTISSHCAASCVPVEGTDCGVLKMKHTLFSLYEQAEDDIPGNERWVVTLKASM